MGDTNDEKESEGVQTLVNVLFQDSIIKLVLDTVEKLDEERDDEKQGIFNALSLLGLYLNFSSALIFHRKLSKYIS